MLPGNRVRAGCCCRSQWTIRGIVLRSLNIVSRYLVHSTQQNRTYLTLPSGSPSGEQCEDFFLHFQVKY